MQRHLEFLSVRCVYKQLWKMVYWPYVNKPEKELSYTGYGTLFILKIY